MSKPEPSLKLNTKSKVILHVITTINRGGAENHLHTLVSQQVKDGHKIIVAYLKGDGYWSSNLLEMGIKVKNLHYAFHGDISSSIRLSLMIRSIRPDLIHCHMPPAELTTRIALKLILDKSTPLIISKHNTEPFWKGPLSGALSRWVSKRASSIIAISTAVSNYMTTRRQLACSNIYVIYYGIDPSPFAEPTPSDIKDFKCLNSLDTYDYIIGIVGRLVTQKSIDTALEAFALYLKKTTCHPCLMIAGDGPLKNFLHSRSVELGIDNSVVWLGFREDIPLLMGAIDLFCLPSIYEGLGLVLLEAMASSKPIAASKVDAIPEIVLESQNGMLFNVKDEKRLCQIFNYFESKEKRKVFGEKGLRRVTQEFSIDRMNKLTNEVYSRHVA